MIKLTKNIFWKKYWKGKNVDLIVTPNILFSDVLIKHKNKGYKSFIEIGGFPGTYSIYAKKYLKLDPTLVDSYTDKEIICSIEKANKLPLNSIKVIKSDIFKLRTNSTYDLVTSFGFIEHFDDLNKVFNVHKNLLSKNGKIIVTVPNFLGINGAFQRKFDPGNLSKHNLRSMDPQNIRDSLNINNLKIIEIFYYGNFGLWLEDFDRRNIILKIIIGLSLPIRNIFKILRINNRLFSPYIVIVAKR